MNTEERTVVDQIGAGLSGEGGRGIAVAQDFVRGRGRGHHRSGNGGTAAATEVMAQPFDASNCFMKSTRVSTASNGVGL